jgi:hypothetical protein
VRPRQTVAANCVVSPYPVKPGAPLASDRRRAEIQTIAFQNSERMVYVVSLAGSAQALDDPYSGKRMGDGPLERFRTGLREEEIFFTPIGRNPLKSLDQKK